MERTKGNAHDFIDDVAAHCGDQFDVRVIGHGKGGGIAQIYVHNALNPHYDSWLIWKHKVSNIAVYSFEGMQITTADTNKL